MPGSKCKNCKRKLTEKEKIENQETSDMASYHCSNDENKEISNDAMEPSRAWIKNIGPGSCKKLPSTTGAKTRLSRNKTTKISKTTNITRKLITTNETVVHHNDVDITAMMEAEAHSTKIETIDSSCEIVEDDTSTGELSAMQTTVIPTKTDDTMNDFRSEFENFVKGIGSIPVTGTSKTNTLTSGRTHPDWTLDSNNAAVAIVAPTQSKNQVQKTIQVDITEEHSDCTLDSNNAAVTIVAPTQAKNSVHNMIQVHMTEETFNKLYRGGFITLHNGKFYYL